MNKFKVGDKVRLKIDLYQQHPNYKKGTVHTVLNTYKEFVRINPDHLNNGYDEMNFDLVESVKEDSPKKKEDKGWGF